MPPARKPRPPAPVLLRVPAAMLARIEKAMKARPVKIPRHTWLLEAVHEKLARELPPRR